MINTFNRVFQSYYNQLPNNTLSTMGWSAICSFPMAFFLQGHQNGTSVYAFYARPLVAAGLAAVVSLIHALMTPIFNAIFRNNNQERFIQEFIKIGVEVGIIRLVVSYATAQKVNLITQFSFFAINLLKSVCHVPIDLVEWFDSHEGHIWRWHLRGWKLGTLPRNNSVIIVV